MHISTSRSVYPDYIVRIDAPARHHHNGMRLVRIGSIFVKLRTYPYGKSHSRPASVTTVVYFESRELACHFCRLYNTTKVPPTKRTNNHTHLVT